MLLRKPFILLPILFGSAQIFAVSVYEPFSYPVGSDLAGQGGWIAEQRIEVGGSVKDEAFAPECGAEAAEHEVALEQQNFHPALGE